MSQIELYTLTNEWTVSTDIFSPVSGKDYFIQNRGADVLVACEGDSAPTELQGIIIPPMRVLKYKLGTQNLYLRALNSSCAINITDGE